MIDGATLVGTVDLETRGLSTVPGYKSDSQKIYFYRSEKTGDILYIGSTKKSTRSRANCLWTGVFKAPEDYSPKQYRHNSWPKFLEALKTHLRLELYELEPPIVQVFGESVPALRDGEAALIRKFRPALNTEI